MLSTKELIDRLQELLDEALCEATDPVMAVVLSPRGKRLDFKVAAVGCGHYAGHSDEKVVYICDERYAHEVDRKLDLQDVERSQLEEDPEGNGEDANA
jgi:hypothetical protein